jgi:hypothetical protein
VIGALPIKTTFGNDRFFIVTHEQFFKYNNYTTHVKESSRFPIDSRQGRELNILFAKTGNQKNFIPSSVPVYRDTCAFLFAKSNRQITPYIDFFNSKTMN